MTRGRAGVDKREGVILEIRQLMNAAVLASKDQALVSALTCFFGDGYRERVDICY
ncbi:hypothetical protein D3C86_2249070 [compost metagenome]